MQKTRKGFNLLEMLVVLGIVIFLSAIILPPYGSMRAKFALLRSAYQLAQDIKMAREIAISARTVSTGTAYGWGVYLREGDSSYIIYADKNNNQKYNSVGDDIFRNVVLENKVYIQGISGSSSQASINFIGPDPDVSVDGSSMPAVITLGLEGSGETENIRINGIGLIYVE